MEILKNRSTARAIMVAMIVLSLIVGVYTSGRSLYSQLEATFYNGERGNGVGVASDMGNRAQAALNMATIARKYLLTDGKDTLTAVEQAAAEVTSASDISRKGEADARLEQCVDELYYKMDSQSLEDKDRQYLSSLYADFSSYGATMSHDPYNEQAAKYNSAISAFPGKVFFSFLGFDPAPIFR